MDISDLIITDDLLNLISELDQFKGSWDVTKGLMPTGLQSLKHIATIESVGSSTRIEGSKLPNDEVEKIMEGLSTRSFATRDEQEVAGYAKTMKQVLNRSGYMTFSENLIKQLHRDLLQFSAKDERHRGDYKKHPNSVEAFDSMGQSLGVIFETSSPFDTPREMEDLVNWTCDNLKGGSRHPLVVIGVFKVVFLAIHPFRDGNGRLSRILTTLLMLQSGFNYVPYSSFESLVEKSKQEYYIALRRTQTTLKHEKKDWYPWMRYFLLVLKHQKDLFREKVDKLLSAKHEELPQESIKIIEHVTSVGRITVGRALKMLDLPRPTVRKRLDELVGSGHLVSRGKGKGTYYVINKNSDSV